jgi:glucose/arabinose dehydrogenase
MKNVSIAVAVAVMLAACGGGGDSSGAGATPASTTTPAAPARSSPAPSASSTSTTTTTAPAGQTVKAPTPPAGTLNISAGAYNAGTSSQNAIVAFKQAVDLTVGGNGNGIWVSAAQSGGKATVSGSQNTIVFMPGVSADVIVTGSSNTFYVPTGASVTVTGTGAGASTIRNYTP